LCLFIIEQVSLRTNSLQQSKINQEQIPVFQPYMVTSGGLDVYFLN